MGTRNLTCVVKNGEYKVAQYGQWDGYPDGQGITILNYLSKWDRERFERNLETTSEITNEEYEKCWKELGITSENGLISLEDSKLFEKEYPHLRRNMAAEILEYIENNEGLKLSLYEEFANDGLMCEWCYVVDLDKNTFEVYEGFNKTVLSENERFYSEKLMKYYDGCPQYYPVKFLISFDLDNLPSKSEFLTKINELVSED